MRASFFPSGDDEVPPEPQVGPKPWWQPPPDEFPARVQIREFLSRMPGAVIVVSHVDVYSVGMVIQIDWEVRRLDQTRSEWQFMLHGDHFSPAPEMLRFGVALANGSTATTVDPRGPDAFMTEPDGWSLMMTQGGGGGDDRRYSGSSGLWLWPLPPPGQIELVGEWGARGLPESRMVLDGSALLDRVTEVQPLWPLT